MSTAHTAYDFEFVSIDGAPMPLSAYKGKVVLIVNTASQCGFTNQYEGLETLYKAYKDRGFVVIGVPSNDFGGQEPGTENDIKKFCTAKFNVTFPLTQKTFISGDGAHPFYKWAADQGVGGFLSSKPRWNFHKYLINRQGQLTDSFNSLISPESDSITSAIEEALGR
jgi:glutathione peroxidase